MSKFVEGLAKVAVAAFGTAGLFAVLLILSPLAGGATGWLFSIVFSDSFAVLRDLLGTNATGFEIGAAGGFIGALFKSGSALKTEK